MAGKKHAVGLAMSKQSEGIAPKDAPKAPSLDARTVTQGDVKALCDLEAEVKRRRAEIEAKIREGWKAEPGPYFARIEQTMNKQSCSKTFLVGQLGEEAAVELWGKLGSKPGERFRYGLVAETGEPVEG